MFRVLLLSCLVAFASAQCGCKAGIFGDERGLPRPDLEIGLYQGDMRLTSNNFLVMLGMRNVARNLWPTRVVPYTVVSGSPGKIAAALAELQSRVGNCVRFKKRSNENDYVEVFNGGGCWSYVGRTGGRQRMSLSTNGCYSTGTIHHEFIHALGLDHEHSRPDRDRHINIHWRNINSKQCDAFYKSGFLPSGFPGYDAKSVMHYESQAFSCNGKDTITTRSGGIIGDNTLTNLDVKKLRAMYNC